MDERISLNDFEEGKEVKIGFDISQTGTGKAGCGYLADSLIQEIARQDHENTYLFYKTFGDFFWNLNYSEIEIIQQENIHEGCYHQTLEDARIFWQKPALEIEKALGSPDILHSNNYFFPEKKLPHTKMIYTLYDLSFMRNPEWTTEQNRFFCFENVFNASLYADHIIAISEYSKKHFLQKFPHYPENKVSVVYPASRYQYNKSLTKSERFSQYPELASGNFWLKTGTIEPRKNHKMLLQAYAKLKESHKEVLPLVLAGGSGWMMHDFEESIDKLGLKENVILLGYVNDNELQWLYQNCYCFLYPSLFEGFGLPVLEAMCCGAPVIASDTSSIPEIAGEAAVLINPDKSDELFEAMQFCVKNKLDLSDLRKKAIERAKMFSWSKNAEKVLSIYKSLWGRSIF